MKFTFGIIFVVIFALFFSYLVENQPAVLMIDWSHYRITLPLWVTIVVFVFCLYILKELILFILNLIFIHKNIQSIFSRNKRMNTILSLKKILNDLYLENWSSLQNIKKTNNFLFLDLKNEVEFLKIKSKYELKEYQEVINEIQKSDLNKSYILNNIFYVRSLIAIGKKDEALTYIKKELTENPKTRFILLPEYINILRKDNKVKEIKQIFDNYNCEQILGSDLFYEEQVKNSEYILAQSSSLDELNEFYNNLPKNLQKNLDIKSIYFHQYSILGDFSDIKKQVFSILVKNWNYSLADFYLKNICQKINTNKNYDIKKFSKILYKKKIINFKLSFLIKVVKHYTFCGNYVDAMNILKDCEEKNIDKIMYLNLKKDIYLANNQKKEVEICNQELLKLT